MGSDVDATFYDGKSSSGRVVRLSAGPDRSLRVLGEDIALNVPLAEVSVSPRVGASRRYLNFPDGARCESADNDGIDMLIAHQAAPAHSLLHRWESRISYALLALALTLFVAWAAITWGVPALAREVAIRLPESAERAIGRDALASLDEALLSPSRLPAERQAALQLLFSGLTAKLAGGTGYRFELRTGGRVGANALALPSGIVVLTDELVALAKNDTELAGVIAHEIGHLREHHALRHVLQNSATALLVAFAVGDIGSITALAATLPTVLLQAKFSRDFEREADTYALEFLRSRGLSPAALADLLERLAAKQRGMPGMFVYLSTHPATAARVARLRGARTQ